MIVYRWRDGSTVRLRIRTLGAQTLPGVPSAGPYLAGEQVVELLACFPGTTAKWTSSFPAGKTADVRIVLSPTLLPQPDGSLRPVLYVENESLKHWTAAPASKLRGLVYALGADRPSPFFPGLLASHEQRFHYVCPTTRFVPNEMWDRRYEIGRSYVVGELGKTPADVLRGELPPFLGWVENLVIQTEERRTTWQTKERRKIEESRKTWHAHWGHGGPRQEHLTAGSFELLVDNLLEMDAVGVGPESMREDWEAVNVEYGEFVMPDEDEVALWKALGEELPFFWGADRLSTWIEERLAGGVEG